MQNNIEMSSSERKSVYFSFWAIMAIIYFGGWIWALNGTKDDFASFVFFMFPFHVGILTGLAMLIVAVLSILIEPLFKIKRRLNQNEKNHN